MTTGAEFQALFQRGKRIDRPGLIVLWLAAQGPTKAGFAVSRQVRRAVDRNRIRRRLRAAYRAARQAVPGGAVVVIIGRPVTLMQPFGELVGQLRAAFSAIPHETTS